MDPSPAISTLAIIGNGFDLAHGYRTRYGDFIRWAGEDFFAGYRRCLAAYLPQAQDWWAFERQAEALTTAFYLRELADDTFLEQVILPFNRLFQGIGEKLAAYLGEEMARVPFRPKEAVARYLTPRTFALSFNYTPLAGRYLDQVFYPHGSLAEGEVLLGYDPPDPLDLALCETRRWFKGLGRERLAFHRYLRQEGVPPAQLPGLWAAFEQAQGERESGKGLEREEIPGRGFPPLLTHYLLHREIREPGLPFPLPRASIRRVVVLGHSLMADRTYLASLLEGCPCLEEGVLFCYQGEPPEEVEAKAAFLLPYCRRVTLAAYR